MARGRSVADLASCGCGWHTVVSAVWDHGQPVVDDPACTADVRAVGVDETTFTHPGPRRHTCFATGLVDLGRGRLLDAVDDRAGSAVTAWLTSCSYLPLKK